MADRAGVPLEMNPLMIKIFDDGIARYGDRELSPNIIRRLEDATGLDIRAPGFPPEMCDDEDSPEQVLEYAMDVVSEYIRKRAQL